MTSYIDEALSPYFGCLISFVRDVEARSTSESHHLSKNQDEVTQNIRSEEGIILPFIVKITLSMVIVVSMYFKESFWILDFLSTLLNLSETKFIIIGCLRYYFARLHIETKVGRLKFWITLAVNSSILSHVSNLLLRD